MDLLEYALNNNIVMCGGGCGASKVIVENSQGDKKGSGNDNPNPIVEIHALKEAEKGVNEERKKSEQDVDVVKSEKNIPIGI